MLRVPGTSHSPSSGEGEQITEWHAKRFSNATDTSQEAPSIATTTASGQDRRAADDANRDTLLAFWEAEQRGNRDIAQGTSPLSNLQRHSWASNRSTSRASSERRNLNAYRPVAGRWTSSMDDPETVGLAQTTDERIEGGSLAPAMPPPQPPPQPSNVKPAVDAVKELHRKSLTPTPLETVEEQSVDEQALRSDSSPTRSYRKPVPEPSDGVEGVGNRASITTPPPPPVSPLRRSMLPTHRRSATTESSGAASKRASEQSHLSAATGALHQHVERLRAGPQYQKDENALHLLEAAPNATPSSYPAASRALPSPNASLSAVGLSSSPPSKRGRAWSLSLINKLKNRTRKSSESSSLLSARVPSFGRLDSPSILTLKPPFSIAADVRPTPPISPLATIQREGEIGQRQQHRQEPTSPSRESGQGAHALYQLARRPLRKAAPTTASSDAEVLTAPPSQLIAAAVQSPAMQRTFSGTSQPRQRPASIASRSSSRSRHSSDASIRALARRRRAPPKPSGDGSDKENSRGAIVKSTAAKAAAGGGTASPSATWWNPWSSRKNSAAGLMTGETGKEEADGWIDEPENEAGIVSPVAQDPNKPAAKRRDSDNGLAHRSSTKASRLDGGSDGTARGSSSVNLLDDPTGRRGSSHDDKDTFVVASGAVAPFASLTASSSFSSLAPTPAPALVPPPRPNRRGKRTDSGSRRASSASSPNSPAMLNEEGRFESSGEIQPSPASDYANTPTLLQAPQPRTTGSSLAGTETRESLLSDDLDYVTPQENEARDVADESAMDMLDEAAALNGYRASLPETGRRPRGIAPHLSPVREMMTPDSRVLSDDRSGALSAASTVDNRAHRRISSGASMGRVVVAHNNTAVAAAEYGHERRPIPAPSVVAEPHANLSPAHRASSITSSFGTSTVGGGAGGRVSVNSMKKHTGQRADLAGAIATVAKKRARQDGGRVGADSRSRSTSMPTKPRSPLSSIDTTVSRTAEYSTLDDPTTSQRTGAAFRESWRSSVDGPWDGRVVSVANVVQLPAAKGLGRPSAGTIRRQRSRSQPMNVMLDEEKDCGQADQVSGEMVDDFSYEPPTAVPFAETAVQASLAALQALEMKEEAEKVGDWRARWASEKLLGFSTSSQPGASLLGPRWTAEARGGDGERRKHRRARRGDHLRQDSPSDSADSRERSAFLAGSKSTAAQSSALANRSFGQDVSIDGLPATSHRVISAAEWDETVVPAHAKRMSYGKETAAVVGDEAEPFAGHGLLASGMVAAAPASPDALAFPTIQDEEKQQQAGKAQQHEEKSVVDHGSQYSYKTRRSQRRKEKSSTYRRREGSDRGDPSRSHRRRHRHRDGGGGEDDHSGDGGGGGGSKTRHEKYPTISSAAASLAKSSIKSRIVRRGYGCDDIVAWQASLSIAALPSVTEL